MENQHADEQNLEMLHDEGEDQQMHDQGPQPTGKLPPLTRKVLLDFILKFDASANECASDCFRVINECIEEPTIFLQDAWKLLHHMIRTNREVQSPNEGQGGFNVV